MKYIRQIFLFILFCILSTSLYAQLQVTRQKALTVAVKKFARVNDYRSVAIDTVYELSNNNGNIVLYEIMFADGAAVLVSGNKACAPILGVYNARGCSLLCNRDNIPCGLHVLIESCITQIDTLFSEHISPLKVNTEWSVLLNDAIRYENVRSSVGPLVQTNWGQSVSNDGVDTNAYNEFAPGEDSCVRGHHCPAGCVAVAMGQIMKFWNYPFFLANSNVTFEWCNMSNELITTSACYDINKHAINDLLQDCGESVDMEYTCSGASA